MKNNKILYGIIIILIAIVCLTSGFILGNSDLFKKENSKEQTENKNEITEKEITSTAEKQKLEEIILLFNNQSIFNDTGSLIGIYSNLSLTNDEKLLLALQSLESKSKFTNVTIPKDQINIENDSDNNETIKEYILNGKQINVTEVENEYYSLFNEKVNNHKSISNTCPVYFYDSTNSVYYYSAECGGARGGEYPLYYANKYTSNGNERYVYINLGYIMMKNSEKTTYEIYTDIEHKNLYKTETKDIDMYNSNIINQSNYKDFSEYKYTFVKNDNGNYYFKSIEKVK